MAREDNGGPRSHRSSPRDGPVVIKKYANRRLYNTSTSSYVTLDHLCQMVKDDVDFTVYDAKTGDDITRSVLTQIIVEEESKGTHLLPIAFLRQLISFYGHSMQGLVPRYLEHMMAAFAANQDRLRQQMQETMSGMFPFGANLGEMSRQNAALMESAMKMFAPFGPASGQSQGDEQAAPSGETGAAREGAQEGETLAQLKRQVDLLQQQLDELSRQHGREGGEAPGKQPATPSRKGGAGSS